MKGNPTYKTPDEMQGVIDAYFDSCKPRLMRDENGNPVLNNKGLPVFELNPPSLTGLCLALGFNSRSMIYVYEKKNDQFSDAIKKARLRCEHWLESRLLGDGIAPASGIFMLKNYGWRDQQDVSLNANLDNKIEIEFVNADSNTK